MPDTVGVIGLGRMGDPMARNFLESGYEVHVFDVRDDAIDDLETAGAVGAANPAAVASDCDVVFVVVQNETQTREVILEAGGIVDGSGEVTVVISSTISPEACRDIDADTDEAIQLLDAPLCRGDDAAQAGELLVLMGGDQDTAESVRDVLEATAAPDDIHHFGELGLGQVAKTANNVLLWSALVADVEVFDLCDTYGIDIDELTDALEKSSGTNWGVNNWTERYPREIPWAHKDMRIALDMAERQGVTMPTAGLLREQVRELQADWEGQ